MIKTLIKDRKRKKIFETLRERLHDTGLKNYFLIRYTLVLSEGNDLKFVFFHVQCMKSGLV